MGRPKTAVKIDTEVVGAVIVEYEVLIELENMEQDAGDNRDIHKITKVLLAISGEEVDITQSLKSKELQQILNLVKNG